MFVTAKQDNKEYEISLVTNISTYDGELLFSIPGEYEVRTGEFRQTLNVQKSEVLNFGTEFGIFSGAVCLLLIAMIVWLKKRKRK